MGITHNLSSISNNYACVCICVCERERRERGEGRCRASVCERGGRGREGCVREGGGVCKRETMHQDVFVCTDNLKCFCDFCLSFGLSIFHDTSMNSE